MKALIVNINCGFVKSLESFLFRKNVIFVNEYISGIEKRLQNENLEKNSLYRFFVNSNLKSSIEIVKFSKNMNGFVMFIRYALFNKIKSFLCSKGLSLHVCDLKLNYKDKIKIKILSINPSLKVREPSALLRDFILVQSLQSSTDFRFPKYLHVALTNKCNLKCIMCPYHSETLKQESHTNEYFDHSKKMPAELLKKIIDEASYYGSSLTFGQYDEPMLYKNFIDYVAYAKEKGCKVSLTSNGTVINEDRARKLLFTGIDHISFSIDASSHESYKKIRGGNFDIPIKNIIKLVEIRNANKYPTSIRACMVLQKDNEHEKEDFKKLMHSIGVDMVSYYNLSTLKGGIWQNEILNFDIEEQKSERYACGQLWSQAMIYPDGNLSLCCATTMYVSYRDDIPYIGNVKDSSIAEMWLSDRYSKIRSSALRGNYSDNSICRDCTIWHNFMGKNSYDSDGNHIHVNPYETFVTFKK